MEKFNVFDCSIIELDRHHSERKGNLTVVENGETLPFDVKRVYYLYDVPGGEERGSHAHRDLSQLIIAASGSFSVTLDDGMAEYKDKAVGKLKDFADNDLSEVIGRVEATVEAANDYTIFTAAADNKSTSVKFIYETEEISNDED